MKPRRTVFDPSIFPLREISSAAGILDTVPVMTGIAVPVVSCGDFLVWHPVKAMEISNRTRIFLFVISA